LTTDADPAEDGVPIPEVIIPYDRNAGVVDDELLDVEGMCDKIPGRRRHVIFRSERTN